MLHGNNVYVMTPVLHIADSRFTPETVESKGHGWHMLATSRIHMNIQSETGGGGEKINLCGMGSIGYDHMLAGSRIHMNKVYGPEKRTA